jgi:hypothetical protein
MDATTYISIMSSAFTCDVCDKDTPPGERHIVRVPRPSDPSDLCGVMWTCPACADSVGAKSESYWEEYIETEEAIKAGHLFLT